MEITARIKTILNRNTEFIKQLGSSYAVFFVNTLVMIFQTPLLLNYMGNDTYGIWLLAQNVINYLTLLNLGFNSVMINQYAVGDPASKDKIFSTVFFSLLLFTGLSAIVFSVILYNLGAFFQISSGLEPLANKIFILMYVVFLLNFIATYFDMVLYYISGRIITKNIIEMVRISLLFGLYFLGVKLDWGIVNLCLVYIGVTFLFLITTILFSLKSAAIQLSFKNFDSGLMKKYFKPGSYYVLLGLTQVFVFNGDNIIIASMLGTAQLTAYSLSFRLSDVAIKLIRKLTETKSPHYVALLKQKDYGKLKKIFHKMQWPVVGLSLAASLLIGLFGQNILHFWLGNQHVFDPQIILVFAIYILISNLYYSNWVMLNLAGEHKGLSRVALLEVCVNICLSILLCKWFGLLGIALATLISTTCLGWLYSHFRLKKFFLKLSA